MRLINVDTYEVEEFIGVRIPPYAILSHCWVNGEEVSFQEMKNPNEAKLKRGFNKIKECCRQAKADGLSYAWVDTCCIDKTSSAELSEAINSMFAWYSSSEICYAYLEDVDTTHNFDKLISAWRKIRWFLRGWTLQELIAPFDLVFFTKDWQPIGSRELFHDAIYSNTGIPGDVLDRSVALDEISVAMRMSWASMRTTSRKEDEAYCLLGIFDIKMPLLYGEGGVAFDRLQEAILNVTHDQTIFLYDSERFDSESIKEADPDYFMSGCLKRSLFAKAPSQFSSYSAKFRPVKSTRDLNPTPSSRERGIKLNLRLTKLKRCVKKHPYLSLFQSAPCPMYLAGLNCTVESFDREPTRRTAVVILLAPDGMNAGQDHDRIFTRFSRFHVLIPCEEIEKWEFSTCYIRNSNNESNDFWTANLLWKTENYFGYGGENALNSLHWLIFPPRSASQPPWENVWGLLLDESPDLPWLMITLSLAGQGEMVSCDIWTVPQSITDKVLAEEMKGNEINRTRMNRTMMVSRVWFWAMLNLNGVRWTRRLRNHGLLARGCCWINDTLEATVSVMGDSLRKVYIHIREHKSDFAQRTDQYNMTKEQVDEAWRYQQKMSQEFETGIYGDGLAIPLKTEQFSPSPIVSYLARHLAF